MAREVCVSATQTILSAVLTTAGTVALAILGERHVYRRWKAERQERQWDQAIAMARVVDNPEEPEMVRALARARLDNMGVTQEWLAQVRAAQHRQLVGGIFRAHPEMTADDADAIDRAIAEPVREGDLKEVSAAVDRIVTYSLEAQAHDAAADRRVRIILLATLFAAVFVSLALTSIFASLR